MQTLNSYNIALNGTQGYQGTISSALNTLKDLVMLNCQGKSKPSPVKVPVCEMPNPTSGPSPQPAPSPAPPPPSIPLVVPQLAGGPGARSRVQPSISTMITTPGNLRFPVLEPSCDDDSSETDGPKVDEPIDPNDLIGPAGFGPQEFLQPGTLSYRVEFENDPAHATAAAQVVTTTLSIDPNLDPATFAFTGFGFGTHQCTVPAGLDHYQTTIDLRPDGIDLLVPVTLDEDPATGAVTVSFQSLDPATMQPPDGINAGVLPVDDAAGDGQGYFTYSVAPRAGLPTGTAITEHASIVFDTNAAIATPTALNTLDRVLRPARWPRRRPPARPRSR